MTAHVPDPAELETRDRVAVRRALVSVSDKRGLDELAAALAEAGVELVSTGSTAARIREAGHPVTEVADVTGFPESLDGRVKTLHPAVHAGLLADRRRRSHREQLEDLGIDPFELVVVNLYPFAETVASGADPEAVVEQIDIGGPAMVRASAKNFANVAIVTDPSRYGEVVAALAEGGTTLAARRAMAAAAFAHTAGYDRAVADWFDGRGSEASAESDTDPRGEAPAGSDTDARDEAGQDLPERIELSAVLATGLRYGENAHQRAALYVDAATSALQSGAGVARAEQLGGKEMSYNNYVDADAALRSAYDFAEPAVAVVKHANPCGIAIADDVATAHAKAHACDPVSAFGGVIAANRTVTRAMAETVAGIFTEVIVAPDYEPDALELLTSRRNLRVLRLPGGHARAPRELRQISGGLLVQDVDRFAPAADAREATAGWRLVAGDAADEATLADLAFAWRAVRAVKSNGILLASGGASVGVGMGQVNRVDACRLAVQRAGERAAGSVAASDAFFPFPDGLEILLEAGVAAVAQPGGSIRDEAVVEAARSAGVTMYLTGERHFAH